MKMKAIVFLLCVVLGCLPLAASYQNGAPDTACRHMFPLGHNKDSQMSTPPYSVEISRKDYTPGSNVTVIIRAKFGIPFRGFFLQARNAECKTENAEGHFYTDETDAKLMPCPVAGSWKNNSVTHTSKNEKLNKTFIWNNKKGGDVFFQCYSCRVSCCVVSPLATVTQSELQENHARTCILWVTEQTRRAASHHSVLKSATIATIYLELISQFVSGH